jgi:hypothetical protein
MKKYDVKDIPEGSFFSQPMYVDDQFVIAAPEMPFSNELQTALEEWKFTCVYSDGEPMHGSFSQNADIAYAAQRLLKAESGDRETLLTYANEFYRLFQKYVEDLFNLAA